MKLLDYWKSASQLLKWTVIALIVLLAISVVHSFAAENRMDEWRDRYDAFRDSAAVISARADSLKKVADDALAVADSLSNENDALEKEKKALQDSLKAVTAELEPVSDENDEAFAELTKGEDVETVVNRSNPQAEAWIRLSFGLKNETDLLDRQNSLLNREIGFLEQQARLKELETMKLRESLDFQTARANQLQAIVDAIPESPPEEKLFGLIPLPNRKTSMIIGAAAGAAGTAVIASQL